MEMATYDINWAGCFDWIPGPAGVNDFPDLVCLRAPTRPSSPPPASHASNQLTENSIETRHGPALPRKVVRGEVLQRVENPHST